MMTMTHMPVVSSVPTASGKGGGTKGGQAAQNGESTFADALTTASSSDASSSSSQAKSQKTPTTAADLLAMLLAALLPQTGAALQSTAQTDGAAASGTAGGTRTRSAENDKTGDKTAAAGNTGLDLRQLLALLNGSASSGIAGLQHQKGTAQDSRGSSGEATDVLGRLLQQGAAQTSGESLNDRLTTLLGLSTKDQSALQNISTDDKTNLLKLLSGQKDVPDAFVQRLQAALAKADPQLVKQLQSRPVTITVGADGQGQGQSSTTATTATSFAAEAQAASDPRGATQQTASDAAHSAKTTVAAARQTAGAVTARPSVPTAGADSAGHSGQDAQTGQELLQGGASELLSKGPAKATSGHSADASGFSLTGLGGHHGQTPSLSVQGEGQAAPPQVPDQQIVDQVVKGVGDAKLKDSTSITVKMHPEDLGQVKLELTVGKDGLKAHLHAQTQQVQDALEKHLPKLRHALEQQGLRLDEMRVSVDSGSTSNQGQSSFAQYQQQGHPSPFQSMPRLSGMRMPAVAASSPATVSGSSTQNGLSVRI